MHQVIILNFCDTTSIWSKIPQTQVRIQITVSCTKRTLILFVNMLGVNVLFSKPFLLNEYKVGFLSTFCLCMYIIALYINFCICVQSLNIVVNFDAEMNEFCTEIKNKTLGNILYSEIYFTCNTSDCA